MSTLEMPQPSDDNSNNNENIVQPGDDTAQEATKASEEWLEALGEPDGNELADASRKHLAAINSLITTFERLSANQTIDEQQRVLNKSSTLSISQHYENSPPIIYKTYRQHQSKRNLCSLGLPI